MIPLLFLASLTPSFASVDAVHNWVEVRADPDRHGTLRETSQLLASVQEGLDGLAPSRLSEVRSATAVALQNCPYNRSAVAIPVVMQRVLARHDVPELDGVKAALHQHVAVLDTLHASPLPLPGPGDYLHENGEGVYTGAQLVSMDDPAAGALQLVKQVRVLVNAYPAETADRIHSAVETVSEATQGHWELKPALLVYRNQLEWALDQGSLDAAATKDLKALHTLLSELVQLSC